MKKLKKIRLTLSDLSKVSTLSEMELSSLRGGLYWNIGCGCKDCSAYCG